MPNGGDKNWVRACGAIDGFRARYKRWPKRVCVHPMIFRDLVEHVLTPIGFALVSSVVAIEADQSGDPDLTLVAMDDDGLEYDYGRLGFPEEFGEQGAREWFGSAILRDDLGW